MYRVVPQYDDLTMRYIDPKRIPVFTASERLQSLEGQRIVGMSFDALVAEQQKKVAADEKQSAIDKLSRQAHLPHAHVAAVVAAAPEEFGIATDTSSAPLSDVHAAAAHATAVATGEREAKERAKVMYAKRQVKKQLDGARLIRGSHSSPEYEQPMDIDPVGFISDPGHMPWVHHLISF